MRIDCHTSSHTLRSFQVSHFPLTRKKERAVSYGRLEHVVLEFEAYNLKLEAWTEM